MTALTTADLTSANASGQGVFDVLMRAVKSHLDEEFKRGAIKGPEYATVYLGSLNLAMQTGLSFLLQQQKTGLEVSILEKQLLLAGVQVDKAAIELAMLTASQAKIPAEIAQIEAQTLLIGQQKTSLIAEALNIPKQGSLLDAQVLVANKQVDIANAEIDIKLQQVLVATAEVGIAQAKLVNIPKEGAHLDAQTSLVTQQVTNLGAEKLDIEAKTLLVTQQRTNLTAEGLNIPKQGAVLDAQALNLGAEKSLTDGKVLNLAAETLNLPKQGQKIDADRAVSEQQQLNLVSENLGIIARTALASEQLESEAFRNFVHPTDPTLSGTLEKERQVLIAQECKLKAEFDYVVSSTAKSAGEIALLAQKTVTESAQVLAMGVDADSVIGKQKALYTAQTNGFTRDAEQKAAKVLVDSWSVRRSTDEATVADGTNMLNDTAVGRAVTKLLTGVGA
jgi:hypothetical protein